MRPGNVHFADGWRDLLEPIVDRYRASGGKLYFRAEAAFTSPDIYEYLEEEGVLYAIGIKATGRLYERVEHPTTRPVGRPSLKPKVFCHDFFYRVKSLRRPRRIIAKRLSGTRESYSPGWGSWSPI